MTDHYARSAVHCAMVITTALAFVHACGGTVDGDLGDSDALDIGQDAARRSCPAPTTPTNLQAIASSASEIDLTWAASSISRCSISSYRIYRDGISVASVTGTETAFPDTGLLASTTYTYQVAAISSAGRQSGLSSAVSASTLAAPGPTPTPTPDPTPTPTPSPRNPLQQPFASTSIWNMPIGSGAVFAPANLAANPDPTGANSWTPVSQPDEERIVQTPTAPLTTINFSSAGWSGANRCSATSGTGEGLPVQVPMPSSYLVPNGGGNNGATFLMPDGRTIAQMQPFARCTAGGPGTSLLAPSRWIVDLYGDGIMGAHGGSGLSSIGGSIRVGELRPGQQGMRHALKVNVHSQWELYHATTWADGFRWPANTADCSNCYGIISGPNNNNPAMKMGTLLAIPSSINISSLGLETAAALQVAWTLQNYGAYIVDSTGGPAFAFSVEEGEVGSFQAQFKADWGFPFYQWVINDTPWSRDIQRIRPALKVVNNNGPTSIGGGGTPLQPLAPAISP